jgi:arabinose-5-phosphate isomerase
MASLARTTDPSKVRLARAAEVLRLEARTIAHLEQRLDERFLRAVDMLLDCQGLIVVTGVGKAGLVGQKISATLASTGTPSLFLHPTEALHGDLGRIRSRDVLFAVSNSGETAEVNALIGPARKIGASVIALTGAPQSTLGRIADCVLDIGDVQEACPLKLAPTASTSAMLAFGDALAMVVSQERNFSRENYALFHPAGSLGRKLMRVREVMRKGDQLPLVPAGTSIQQAVVVMNRTPGRPGAALITDASGLLVGIFTHGDLSRLFERHDPQGPINLGELVDKYMGKNPKSIGPDQLVEEAQHLMQEFRIDQVAVIDAEHRPVGLLDVQDLLDVRV